MNNLWYLIAAYGIIWAALFIYVFSIEHRQRRLREDLMALEIGMIDAEPIDSDPASHLEVSITARG